MNPAPTPRTDAWNITRIVAAHDCNHGQIPNVAILTAQLEAFCRDALAAKDREIARLNELNVRCAKDGIAHAKRAEKAEAELAEAQQSLRGYLNATAAIPPAPKGMDWVAHLIGWVSDAKQAIAERDALRSEANQLRAEVERLKGK